MELKMEILIRADYATINFITNDYFWNRYWTRYNELNSNPGQVFNSKNMRLNAEQQYVLEMIESGKSVFLASPAGTGKSVVVRSFFEKHVSVGNIGLTATTGISALNINGQTLHSFLGIGLAKESVDDLQEIIIKNTQKHKTWITLKTLIIDEVGMLRPDLFDKLEILARRLRKTKAFFGGIQLVLSGDLFQLPCVDRSGKLIIDSESFSKCISSGKLCLIQLRNIIRQDDAVFKTILNKIRFGIVDKQVAKFLDARKKAKIPKKDIKPTKLSCTKKSVSDINEKELNKLATKGHEFREYEMSFVDNGNSRYFASNTKTFIKNSTTPQVLQICQEAQVMLTYNLTSKLVNGSRGIVRSFTDINNYPVVEFLNGVTITVEPVKFDIFTPVRNTVEKIGHAVQIPLKVAYATTIHSCQGSTLDYAQIDLSEAFEYGQAYTAFSRVKNAEGLFIKPFNYDAIQAHPKALKFFDTDK
jgi:ATP-dependent DNA helicase PIF1